MLESIDLPIVMYAVDELESSLRINTKSIDWRPAGTYAFTAIFTEKPMNVLGKETMPYVYKNDKGVTCWRSNVSRWAGLAEYETGLFESRFMDFQKVRTLDEPANLDHALIWNQESKMNTFDRQFCHLGALLQARERALEGRLVYDMNLLQNILAQHYTISIIEPVAGCKYPGLNPERKEIMCQQGKSDYFALADMMSSFGVNNDRLLALYDPFLEAMSKNKINCPAKNRGWALMIAEAVLNP